jgi:hypothetical protein
MNLTSDSVRNWGISSAKHYLYAITPFRLLPNWVRYHRWIGIDRFCVFDNYSTDRDQLASPLTSSSSAGPGSAASTPSSPTPAW